jgi:hypothetical protein
VSQPLSADAGFVLDFLERIRPVLQNAERAARARLGVDPMAPVSAEREAAANAYELRIIAACVELGETVRDEIRRAVHEAIAASGRGVAVNLRFSNLDELRELLSEHAGSSSSRPSEVRDLDTSVESPTTQVMNESPRADVEDSPVPEKAL